MAKKNSGAWLLPVVILALPGFMFYFWWSHLGGAHKITPIGKLHKSVIPGLFNAAPPDSTLDNPITSDAHSHLSNVPPVSSKSPKSLSTQSVVNKKETRPLGGKPSPPIQKSSGLTSSLNSPGNVAATKNLTKTSGGSSLLPSPQIKRDPTLSPDDRRELRDRLKPKRFTRAHIKPKKKEPPIESLLSVQGIIFISPSNVKAIVNGHILRPGELVHGAKIIKILPQKVIFSYKGRQFVKVMNGK